MGLRFTRIQLENWRNFAKVEVDLQWRVFLVGPNASGKSNFLDVFRFLRDIGSVGGGFQEAVRKRGGVSKPRCLAARQDSDVIIKARLGDDEDPFIWEYELQFTQDKSRGRPSIKRECVRNEKGEILGRPVADDRSDPDRLTQTYLEQVNVNKTFRNVAKIFESVRYLHIVPQLVREPVRSQGLRNDPFGGDFLEEIGRVNEKVKKVRLRQISDALRNAVPQLEKLEWTRDEQGIAHLRGKYIHWRPSGAWQTEEQFSDGTLRLIGLLWAALDEAGPLLLEEPELSLHPAIVRHIPSMLFRLQRGSGRQALISTHSADLLSKQLVQLSGGELHPVYGGSGKVYLKQRIKGHSHQLNRR